MKKSDIESRTESLVLPILDKNSFSLWDVEYVKEGSDMYLRVYIDKEGGVNIDDCVTVSRELDKLLDEEDFIKDAYILEVSSPGLTRRLKKDRDFEKSIGRLVYIKLYKPIDSLKEYTGVLKAFDESSVSIEVEDVEKSIPRDAISLIRLEFEE
jgi:Uncharacterized protein conserved in bacteria